MLDMDEDDFFVGSPRSKFYDIVYHANQNLVMYELDEVLKTMIAYEMLLEEMEPDFEKKIRNIRVAKEAEIEREMFNKYITHTGNILTKNE